MAEPLRWRYWIGGLALFAAVLPTAAGAAELSASQQRGKEIYFNGTSPSGVPITAFFGEDRLEVPGDIATCGSCHGHDGKGRPESGVVPSNITWKYLTRSYGHRHADGLEHPPFDEASLRDYLRTGIFPGGRRGDPSMPLYKISEQDLTDLIAYLERLGGDLDPGLSDTTIQVGTIVPAEGALGEVGGLIRQVLEGVFRDVNQAGGIYGRRIELEVYELAPAEESAPEAVARWLADSPPFALVGPFTPRIDLEVHTAASGEGIPVIGPLTLYSLRSFVLNRNVFYLYPGLGEQLETLLGYAGSELGLSTPRLAVLYPEQDSPAQVLADLEKSGAKMGWPVPLRTPFSASSFDAAETVADLEATGIEVVVFLGVEGELRSFLQAASTAEWLPYVLAPGALSGGVLFEPPQGFEDRLFVAYPTLPQDRKPWALREIARLMEGNDGARSHLQAVISSYASASVLIESLRRAGRDLGRRELIGELEKLYRFDTGLTPPITFTANRRVGARGAYVIGPQFVVDGRLPESVDWKEAN